MSASTSRARWAFAAAVGGTVGLYASPFAASVGYPLMLLSTLAHELGHGIAAWFSGARFTTLSLWPDGSGAATWAGEPDRLRQAFVAGGGLVGPALAAALLFAAGRRPRAVRAGLWIVGAGLLAIDLLLVRNLFGFAFIGLVALGLLGAAWKAPDGIAQPLVVFLAVQLAMSVFSRGDYLFTDVADTAAGTFPSDVAQMAEALWLPYWFWGAACGLLSVAVLGMGAAKLLRGR